ncbi:MAG: diaminopimelate epimerase [bacterium]
MELNFTKMHGLGNDFMVVDAINQAFLLNDELIRQLADRRFGIGFDQLLLVERPRDPDTEFYYRIYNADGSEVEQCGNGARCFARFVLDQGLTDNQTIHVGTAGGPIVLQVEDDQQVTVNMGAPILDPAAIPFKAAQQAVSYRLSVADETVEIGAVSMGNPHAVMLVDDVEQTPVDMLGPQIESHPAFPNHVNAGFLEIADPQHARLRVYERGAGETLACGTGACAAVVYGHLRGQLTSPVTVSLRGGDLVISWDGNNHPVMMTGPATRVFDGRITL